MPKYNPKKSKGSGAPRKSFLSSEKDVKVRAAGKKHAGAGTIYDFKNRQLTAAGLAVILIMAGAGGVLIWGATTGWTFGFQMITPGTPTGTFSVGVWNGVTFDKLRNQDFSYDLFGTNNTADGPFTFIESGTSLDSLSNADLVDFTQFVVKYRGSVEIQNPKSTDSSDTYFVPFYERQDQIFAGKANTLYAYQEPSATGIFAMDNEAITPVSFPVAKNTNISITVRTNSTETSAAWVRGWNYWANAEISPRIVITFTGGSVLAQSDFIIGGTTRTLSGMTLSFSFSSISSVSQVLEGVWGAAVTSTITGISAIDLYYGPTLLASV